MEEFGKEGFNNFHFKDSVPQILTSNVNYKFHCGLCNLSYYRECNKHLAVKSHSWQRVPNPPILSRAPILPTPLSNFVNPLPSFSLYPLPLLMPSCFGWMVDCITLMCYSTYDIMDPQMPSRGAIVPEGSCCLFMQQGVKFTEV